MADNALKIWYDLLDSGPRVGESLNEFRLRAKTMGALIERYEGHHAELSVANLGNTESGVAMFRAPFNLEITGIAVSKNTVGGALATGSLNNRDAAAGADKNPIAAADIDIDALAADDTSYTSALSATTANKQMNAGDILTWTVVSGAGTTVRGATAHIAYKPITRLG